MVWFVLLPAGWLMVVRIDETMVVDVRSMVVKMVETTGLLLLPPPVEEGAGFELEGGTVDDWIRHVGSALDLEGTIRESMPGPKMQLEGVPKQTALPLSRRVTALMVKVSWEGVVATSRAFQDRYARGKDRAQGSPSLPNGPYLRRQHPGSNLSRVL